MGVFTSAGEGDARHFLFLQIAIEYDFLTTGRKEGACFDWCFLLNYGHARY